MGHPMQPIVFTDPEHPNSASFKPNEIVSFLLKFARGKGVGLNELGDMPWSQEDWDQFYQLIGMTVSGYSDCSLVSDAAKDAAEAAAKDAEAERGPLTVGHSADCVRANRRGCIPGCPNYDSEFDAGL